MCFRIAMVVHDKPGPPSRPRAPRCPSGAEVSPGAAGHAGAARRGERGRAGSRLWAAEGPLLSLCPGQWRGLAGRGAPAEPPGPEAAGTALAEPLAAGALGGTGEMGVLGTAEPCRERVLGYLRLVPEWFCSCSPYRRHKGRVPRKVTIKMDNINGLYIYYIYIIVIGGN